MFGSTSDKTCFIQKLRYSSLNTRLRSCNVCLLQYFCKIRNSRRINVYLYTLSLLLADHLYSINIIFYQSTTNIIFYHYFLSSAFKESIFKKCGNYLITILIMCDLITIIQTSTLVAKGIILYFLNK